MNCFNNDLEYIAEALRMKGAYVHIFQIIPTEQVPHHIFIKIDEKIYHLSEPDVRIVIKQMKKLFENLVIKSLNRE